MYKQSLFAITALAMLSSNAIATQKLEDVVVTAKSNKSINDLAGAVTVITADEIKRLNATNVKDALVKMAGVNVTPAGTDFGRQGISIRGSQSDHVLILVDGKKVSGTDGNIRNSDFQFSMVPMNLIERIEVIKGAMSSIYGSEAIGGVINIITKKVDEEFFGSIDLQFGSNSDDGGTSREYGLNIGGKVSKDLSILLSAEKKDIDVITKKSDTYIEGKDYTNGSLKVSYNIDDTQTIGATYSAGNEDRLHKGDKKYYDIERKSYDLSYKKHFDEVSLNLDYYVNESENFYVDRNNIHDLKNEILKADVEISAFKNNYIASGIEIKKEKYDDNLNAFSDKQTTKSIYLQDEIELGEDFIFTLGARYDDHEVFGGELSPKAGLVYKLTQNQRLKFSYGEGFIAPGLKENSSEYLYVSNYGITVAGNPDLKPETSKNYELGYEYYMDNGTFKVSVFKNDVKNLINTAAINPSNPMSMAYTYDNKEEVTLKGAEFEVDYSISENHDIAFNYTHLDAKNKADDEKLTFRPENTANLILSSQLPYSISSTLSASYIGSQEDGVKKVKSYTIANAQFSKNITNDLSVRIGVDNIGNKKFDSDRMNVAGRFYYMGLNYKF